MNDLHGLVYAIDIGTTEHVAVLGSVPLPTLDPFWLRAVMEHHVGPDTVRSIWQVNGPCNPIEVAARGEEHPNVVRQIWPEVER